MPRAAFGLTGSRPGVISSPAAFEDMGLGLDPSLDPSLDPDLQPHPAVPGGMPEHNGNGNGAPYGPDGLLHVNGEGSNARGKLKADKRSNSLHMDLAELAMSPHVVVLGDDGTPTHKYSASTDLIQRSVSDGPPSSHYESYSGSGPSSLPSSNRNSHDLDKHFMGNGDGPREENGVHETKHHQNGAAEAKHLHNGRTGANGNGVHVNGHDSSGPPPNFESNAHRVSLSKGVQSRRNLFSLISSENNFGGSNASNGLVKESSFNSYAESSTGSHGLAPEREPSNRDVSVDGSFMQRGNLVGMQSPVSQISGHRRSSCGSFVDAYGIDRKSSGDQAGKKQANDPMAARRALLHAGAFHASLIGKSSTTHDYHAFQDSVDSLNYISRVASEPHNFNSGKFDDYLMHRRRSDAESATDSDYFPYQDDDGSLLAPFGRTYSIPELKIRRRKLRQDDISDSDDSFSFRGTTSWVSEQSAFHSAASSSSSTKMEGGGAERLVLQTVVNQLRYGKIPAASSAAAAVEYLVSSSEPKKAGPPSLGGWRWSVEGAKLNREALGQFPGLFDSLLRVLKEGTGEACAKVCGAMSKLGFRNTGNVLAMMQHKGILEALTALLADERGPKVQVQAWRVLQNCVSGIDEVKVILCENDDVVEQMKKAVANDSADEKQQEIRMRAVSVIMHASSNDTAKQHLLRARIPEDALSLVLSSDANTQQASATRIRATLASANLCGREERSILSTAPEMLMEIVKCVSHALDETEYCGIKWSLAGVALPLFNLSCSDSNKISLIQCGVVELLLKIIQDDGTGAEPLEFALRSLANFTFNDEAKQQMLDQDILDILDDMVASIGEKNDKAKSVVKDLVYMLSENQAMDVEEQEEHEPSHDEAWHIMISYSWAEKKHHVEELTVMLRNKGYSIWRDEEGSELVQKMMGSSMEIMAKAIEVAKFVIVFVSRAYRDSYNCKLEGKYAQQRERAGLVKILFVMMEEDFTPQSEAGVDGWLGMMIADAIWYCGWNYEQLGNTADALQKVIEKALAEQARDHNQLTRTQSSVQPIRAPSTMPTKPTIGDGGSSPMPTGDRRGGHNTARLKSASLTPVLEAPQPSDHHSWRSGAHFNDTQYIPPAHAAGHTARRYSSPTNEPEMELSSEVAKWLEDNKLMELKAAFAWHRS